MRVNKITNQIFHVEMDSRFELAATFCRFQEYYESPEFKGKFFSLTEYKNWYIKEKGDWSYYSDWTGFNVPGYAILYWNPKVLEPNEAKLYNYFAGRIKPFYVIGTFKGTELSTMGHELSHARYYINSSYKDAIDDIISECASLSSEIQSLQSWLLDLGYHNSVLNDEIQAYIINDCDYLKTKGIKIPWKIRRKFLKIHKKFLKKGLKA